VTDQRQLNLPLFALGAVAAHAVVLAALLPMLVTLPGPGSIPRSPLIIDVDVTPGASLAPLAPRPEPPIPADAATTSALPEPSPPAPAETAAAIAADPMTTQSTAPMADTGQASAVPGAESVGAPSDSAKTHEDAGLPASPPAGALARAEPPETLPPDAPATSAATAQATANAPKVEVPKPVAAPAVKKATAVRARPVTPRANRVLKAKPKAPASGADFKSLFSGTILAPTIPKAPAARDQRATR
jgi:cytoskeleton protein RodZ